MVDDTCLLLRDYFTWETGVTFGTELNSGPIVNLINYVFFLIHIWATTAATAVQGVRARVQRKILAEAIVASLATFVSHRAATRSPL